MARHGRRTRQEARRHRRQVQCQPDELSRHRILQGLLSGDDDGSDRRLPRPPAARHRAGLRGRHRHHDGGEGRGLSGLQADEGYRHAVRSRGLPAGGGRLLHRHRRQHAVDAVQLVDADPLLQQGRVQEGRARSRDAAQDLGGRRGLFQEDHGFRRGQVRLHHALGGLDPARELLGLAQPADRHQPERFRQHQFEADRQRPGPGPPLGQSQEVAGLGRLRIWRPGRRQRRAAEVL